MYMTDISDEGRLIILKFGCRDPALRVELLFCHIRLCQVLFICL